MLQKLLGLLAHARNAEALVDGLDGVLVHKVFGLERALCLAFEGIEEVFLQHGEHVVLANKRLAFLSVCEELLDARGKVLFERAHDALRQVAAHAPHLGDAGHVGRLISVGRGALGPNGAHLGNGEAPGGVLFVEALKRTAHAVLVCS